MSEYAIPSFRELSVIQRRFSEAYMVPQPSIFGVRIRRQVAGPIIEVKHDRNLSSDSLGLPLSFEGLPVVARVGSPSDVAV
jgi:hypothetical protein